MFKYEQNSALRVPFKTITIKKSAYELIRRKKRAGESFTALFERTFGEQKPDIMRFAGALSKSEADELRKNVLAYRKEFNADAERRIRDVRARL